MIGRTPARARDAADDDFDWRTYNPLYRRELADLAAAEVLLRLHGDEYRMSEGVLQAMGGALLHPNHRLLYETVLMLGPQSVFEMGCGGGDHLHNLHALGPSLSLHGCDVSGEQLAFFRERNPDLPADVEVVDATLPFPGRLSSVDLAYTQAVIMHMQTGNGHMVALTNLFRISDSYVVLMENWRRHAFHLDITRLFDDGVLGWDSLNLYVRRAPELGDRPHLAVASRSPLDLEPWTSDAQLAQFVAS